jgi:hypothetical protein
MLNSVQNGLNFQLHGWPLVSSCYPVAKPVRNPRSASFFYPQPVSIAPAALSQHHHPRSTDLNAARAVLFAGAGERRGRASEPPLADPPVATRNGLAPPLQIGAPLIPIVTYQSNELVENSKFTHDLCCTAEYIYVSSAKFMG